MNQKQNDHFEMFKVTSQTLTNFKSIWNSNPLLVSLVDTLDSSITEILETDQLQNSNTTGITQSKNMVKDQLISQVTTLAGAGKGYAASINDNALKAACNLVKSKLVVLSPADLIAVSQNLHDTLTPITAALTNWGVNSGNLASLQTTIDLFTNIISAPQTARTSTKAATDNISQIMKKVVDFLDEQLDTAMLQFKASNANFYAQYRNARKLIIHGHRTKVIIKGIASIGVIPAANAEIAMIVNGKVRKKITGINGKYSYLLSPPVNTNITANLSGYPQQTKTVNANIPQTQSVNFIFNL